MTTPRFTTLFLDIGGVLLTNGWDHHVRRRAAKQFGLDYDEMNERHHLTFDTYESGKLTLEAYLDRVVFDRPRHFSRQDFERFMFDQSQPLADEIDFFLRLKARHGLLVTAVSNEGRELTEYRVREFKLRRLIDLFVSSCFVHLRKPDEDLYRVALDVSQARPDEVVYIDDRLMFVEVARKMGIRSIHRVDGATVRSALAELGLVVPGEPRSS
jgi:putative hydrolase of the HAD superfamily